MIGRTLSLANLRSMDHTSCRRRSGVLLPRLGLNHPVHLGIAVTVPVQRRPTSIKGLKRWIGIGPAGLKVQPDRKVMPIDPWIVEASVERLQFTVDVDFLEVVKQDDRWIAK